MVAWRRRFSFEKVSTAEEFTAAIEDGGKIKLMDNITLDDFFVSSDVVLDMNGYDITSKWMFNAEDDRVDGRSGECSLGVCHRKRLPYIEEIIKPNNNSKNIRI